MKYRNGGFLISKIHQLSGRIFARKLKESGVEDLNPAQGRILFVLWQRDGISIQELSKKTSLEKSTLTSMLDRLEQSGHLCRKPCSDDRRKTLIYLSSKHHTYRETFDHVSKEMIRLYYEGLSTEEIDTFESYLERILINLERHAQL
ncbi:MAG TPA: MarR family transcriptional regulator [Firmicutes bacterium]|jgi:DNA-binding MarR family transcriptional regulator|nr:MarR family transcriptional regulator [Bacillota bacterium]HCF90221.1 MarR family transcriptional regulator [Bacillota bacterium]